VEEAENAENAGNAENRGIEMAQSYIDDAFNAAARFTTAFSGMYSGIKQKESDLEIQSIGFFIAEEDTEFLTGLADDNTLTLAEKTQMVRDNSAKRLAELEGAGITRMINGKEVTLRVKNRYMQERIKGMTEESTSRQMMALMKLEQQREYSNAIAMANDNVKKVIERDGTIEQKKAWIVQPLYNAFSIGAIDEVTYRNAVAEAYERILYAEAEKAARGVIDSATGELDYDMVMDAAAAAIDNDTYALEAIPGMESGPLLGIHLDKTAIKQKAEQRAYEMFEQDVRARWNKTDNTLSTRYAELADAVLGNNPSINAIHAELDKIKSMRGRDISPNMREHWFKAIAALLPQPKTQSGTGSGSGSGSGGSGNNDGLSDKQIQAIIETDFTIVLSEVTKGGANAMRAAQGLLSLINEDLAKEDTYVSTKDIVFNYGAKDNVSLYDRFYNAVIANYEKKGIMIGTTINNIREYAKSAYKNSRAFGGDGKNGDMAAAYANELTMKLLLNGMTDPEQIEAYVKKELGVITGRQLDIFREYKTAVFIEEADVFKKALIALENEGGSAMVMEDAFGQQKFLPGTEAGRAAFEAYGVSEIQRLVQQDGQGRFSRTVRDIQFVGIESDAHDKTYAPIFTAEVQESGKAPEKKRFMFRKTKNGYDLLEITNHGVSVYASRDIAKEDMAKQTLWTSTLKSDPARK
jgi:hypothetical protein